MECIARTHRQNVRPDFKVWDLWWKENKATFKIDLEAVTKRDLRNAELGSKSDVEYYEIPIFAMRLLFVLDRSGSMGPAKRAKRRILGLRKEMTQLINGLRPDMRFNTLSFSAARTCPGKR